MRVSRRVISWLIVCTCALRGVRCSAETLVLRLAATDGHRLARLTIDPPPAGAMAFPQAIVGRRTLFLQDARGDVAGAGDRHADRRAHRLQLPDLGLDVADPAFGERPDVGARPVPVLVERHQVATVVDGEAQRPGARQEAELEHMPPIIGNVPLETAEQIARTDQKLLAERSIKSTDHFVATFFDKTVSVPFLMEILASLPQGSSELMTHPGQLDDQLRKESSYSVRREDELSVLTNSRVLEYLDELDIKLITFADL